MTPDAPARRRSARLGPAVSLCLALLAVSCGPGRTAGPSGTGSPPGPGGPPSADTGLPNSADPVFFPARSRSELPPAATPKLPAVIPGYAGYDPDSGLHVTGQYVELELASWRLAVTGAVRNPLELDFDALRTLPGVRSRSTLVCPGYFEDNAVWAGASLAAVLDLTGAYPDAKGITLVGADGYSTWVDMERARDPQNFLAYEFADHRPVPILHGFPVRAVFPALAGAKWAKWLVEIRVEYADPPKPPPPGSVPGS